jgi:two-component system CheB/CheR fusion protein
MFRPLARGNLSFVLILSDADGPQTEALTRALSAGSPLSFVIAADGMALEPGHVFVAGRDRSISLAEGRIWLAPPPRPDQRLAPSDGLPVDSFLESLALDCAERAVAVVVAGAGNDGALGVRAIKDMGGLALAQDPDTATPRGMPDGAVATGLIDQVLAPRDLAARVLELTKRAGGAARDARSSEPPPRIAQPADRHVAGGAHPVDLHATRPAARHPGLLMPAGAWTALRERVLEPMIRGRAQSESLRIWVPQCGTGVDAYSVALLVEAVLDDLDARLDVKVLATDLDEQSLHIARAGLFSERALGDPSVERDRYLIREDDRRYRVVSRLRNEVLFASHDLLHDPPFSRLDLIVCRGLIASLELMLQARILRLFHRALLPGGALFVGDTDTIAAQRPELLFEAVDRKWRIFSRVGSRRRRQPLLSLLRAEAEDEHDWRTPVFAVSFDSTAPPRVGRAAEADANDESTALGEQLQDAVEDLRAMNEELESSREELQSMNEEQVELNDRLSLVNTELEAKVRELESTTDDLANLLDGTEVATVFLDRQCRLRRFTPAIRGLIELRESDLGRPLSHFNFELDDASLLADIERVLVTSTPIEAVARGKHDRWFLRRIVPYRTAGAHARADGVVLTFTDITWRQRAEESLRRANEDLEERVRRRTATVSLLQDVAVIANNTAPMERAFAATLERLSIDVPWIAGHVYVVHAGVAEDSGVWHVTAQGRDREIRSLLGDRAFFLGDGRMGRVLETGEASWSSDLSMDERFQQEAATSLGVRSTLVSPILVGERVVGAFEFFSAEADEPNEQLLEVMRNVGTQLGRVIEREEARERELDLAVEEQRSLGEELHDTLSQQIHGLSMLAQSLVQTFRAPGMDPAPIRALVDGLLDTHRQIRMLSNGLVPVRIEAGGLEGVLEEMARGWEQMHGVQCVFEHEGDGDPDDERIATALYRIAREAARNAVLHGAAQRIVIRLVGSEDALELQVHDDGRGMAEVPVAGPGMGLQIMRHRAHLVGGALEIDSEVGRGTVVRCRIESPRARGAGSQP